MKAAGSLGQSTLGAVGEILDAWAEGQEAKK